MLCVSATYAVMRCVSVCVSVTFVDHVKTNKHIFQIFSPSVSHTILVFPYQTGWRYSDGNLPNMGASNAGGVGRNRDSKPIFLLLTRQQASCRQHGRQWTTATISQVVTHIVTQVPGRTEVTGREVNESRHRFSSTVHQFIQLIRSCISTRRELSVRSYIQLQCHC